MKRLAHLCARTINHSAWVVSWWYQFFGHPSLIDYTQVTSDFGAMYSPHITGSNSVFAAFLLLARSKAMRRVSEKYGKVPRGTLVRLNPRLVR